MSAAQRAPLCAVTLWAFVFVAGCASARRAHAPTAYRSDVSRVSETQYQESVYGGESSDEEADSSGPSVQVDVAAAAPVPTRALYARASTSARREDSHSVPEDTGAPDETRVASDAIDPSRPLLIYTAQLHLAVYEVNETQETLVDATRGLGGFVFARSDDRLVIRVPSARFQEALALIEGVGQVEHREVQAQDVSEEYHDVGIRIHTLEVMRQRVEQLLATASSVEDALAVERELQRITGELEHLRGRMRFLSDRIAFSTITVLFRPRPRESLDQPDIFELPFAWLDELGLGSLLQLRRGSR